MKPELPSTPTSIGGVLDSAFRLYRSTFSRCWYLAAVGSALGLVYGIEASMQVPTEARSSDPAEAARVLVQTLQAFFSPSLLVLLGVGVLVSCVFSGALIATESGLALKGPSFSLGKALGVGLRRLPAMLIGGVVWTLIVGVGTALFVIPGIYFFGKLQLWTIAMFVDDVGPFTALGRSWSLTRQRWWRGVVILSVALVIIAVFSVAFSLLSLAVAGLANLGVTERMILTQVFSLVSNALFLPLSIAITVAMYHDFNLRSRGGDLAARVDALKA
jgi:hypothetical protein